MADKTIEELDPMVSFKDAMLTTIVDLTEALEDDQNQKATITQWKALMATIAAPSIQSYAPTISFAGGTTGIIYTSQLGFFHQVGGKIFIKNKIVVSNKGSSAGFMRIDLPVVSSNDANMPSEQMMSVSVSGLNGTFGSFLFALDAYISKNTIFARVFSGQNDVDGLGSSLADTNMDTAFTVWLDGFYFI